MNNVVHEAVTGQKKSGLHRSIIRVNHFLRAASLHTVSQEAAAEAREDYKRLLAYVLTLETQIATRSVEDDPPEGA